MPYIEASQYIRAMSEHVWRTLCDPKLAPEWMPDLDRRELLTSGAIGAGAHWRDHGRLRRKAYQAEYEICEWQPPVSYSYQQSASRRTAYTWVETVRVEPHEDGALVTLRLDYTMPGGLGGQLYERMIFRKDFRLTLENRLDALRDMVEGQPSDDEG